MTNRDSTRIQHAVTIALILLIGWMALHWLGAAYSRNLHFDGAMNLEVARSLAAGEGPRRLYDGRELFPYEIQTKEPYVLLAALVYKVAGVGPVQSQIPNLIYLLFACLALGTCVHRHLGTRAALAATLALLAAPMGPALGLNGLGELPAFAFILASLALAARPVPPGTAGALLTWSAAAGVMAGLALATKTVAAIMFCACAIVVALNVLSHGAPTLRARLAALATVTVGFTLGGVLPLLAIEMWKLSSLGPEAYRAWWHIEFLSIGYQAGVSDQQEAGGLAKAARHFGILAQSLGASTWLLGGALGLAFAASVVAALRSPSRTIRLFLCGLLVIVAIYFVWWLMLTPTEKAWLRRIFVGLTALSIAGTLSLFVFVDLLRRKHGPPAARWIPAAILAAAAALPLLGFTWKAAVSAPEFERNAELVRTLELADAVRALPDDALVLAYGWYSAPAVALFSGRQFIDYTDWPVSRMIGADSWLITDSYNEMVRIDDALRSRYASLASQPDRTLGQLYRIDFSSIAVDAWPWREVFEGTAQPTEAAGAESFDAALDGFWVASDVLFRMPAGTPPTRIELDAYMPPDFFYRLPEPLSGTIHVAGCEPIGFAFRGEGWETFSEALTCGEPTGTDLAPPGTIRIVLDNVLDMPKTHDLQRAMVVRSLRLS